MWAAWIAAAVLAAMTSTAYAAPADVPDGTAKVSVRGAASETNIVALHSGMCLEAASTASGEPVRQRHCVGKRGSLWILRQSSLGSDLVQVVNAASGLCLAVAESSSADGAPVRQERCGAQPGANFRTADSGDGAWLHPMTASPHKCVGVAAASVADRAELQQWPCNGSAGVRFEQRRPPHEWRTTIVNTTSGKCLGIRNASRAELEWALQRTCSGAADESWRIVVLEQGVAIANVNSDKCLVATRDMNGANGSQAKQATCEGYPYQRWTLEERAPGVYALRNHLLTTQYLGLRAPLTDEAALAEFWERSPDHAQEWRISTG
ncbi:RICIN domain-containing protein [Streptomyces sp. NPDC050703]|uniref:RICIN domain-containing protein n=1 Tax=Streptomyces sp. NPDC050703 TaxID=3157218 RepID=UPI003446AE5A